MAFFSCRSVCALSSLEVTTDGSGFSWDVALMDFLLTVGAAGDPLGRVTLPLAAVGVGTSFGPLTAAFGVGSLSGKGFFRPFISPPFFLDLCPGPFFSPPFFLDLCPGPPLHGGGTSPCCGTASVALVADAAVRAEDCWGWAASSAFD